MKNMKTKIMSLLGLLVMGITAAYGSQTDQPKMNGKLIVRTLAPEEIRYTGKPYSKALGAYVFNYRNYDPQLARWTTPDPSGFPDGANNRVYVNNQAAGALDPNGLTFLHYTGGRAGDLEVWSGGGWSYEPGNPRGSIDWGDKLQSWSAVSGSDNSAPINRGWWDTRGFAALGWDPSHRPEYDYIVGHEGTQYNGTGNGAQGSMSLWAPAGYAYGSIQFKEHLKFIDGRGYTNPNRSGISIHPDGPVVGITAGCIGISEYQDAVQVHDFLSHFLGEVYVE